MEDTRVELDDSPAGKSPDRRTPRVNDELSKHAVVLAPVIHENGGRTIDPSQQGSGTCVRIGGRFLIATAAHVVSEFPKREYAILSPSSGDKLLKIVRGGMRGGRPGELDIAWLELSARAAAEVGRSFLDLARITPNHDGSNERLCLYGAPLRDRQWNYDGPKPAFSAGTSMWPTRTMTAKELPVEPGPTEIHLLWPNAIKGTDGGRYEYPEAPGLSGGGLWALGAHVPKEEWRADCVQLIGIEFAQRKDHGWRFLVAQRMFCWLEMVAQDVPELSVIINAHLAGSALIIDPSRGTGA